MPLEQSHAELEQSLQRGGWELQELNHRIANSLLIASSFLSAQDKIVSDPLARRALSQTAGRLLAISKFHKYLYTYSGNQSIDLKNFLAELCPIIAQGAGLECSVDAESVLVSSDMAQQLAIIINELAINSAKHAFKPNQLGKLTVVLRRAGGDLRLTVSDDGEGLSQDFDVEAEGRFGMAIIGGIVRQLGGALQTENANGARFILTMPVHLRTGPPAKARPESRNKKRLR